MVDGKDSPGRSGRIRAQLREVERLRLMGKGVVDACTRVGLPLSTFYYRPRVQGAAARARHEAAVRAALARLRERHPADGYRRLARRLAAEGLRANHKLVYRICREAGWLRPRGDPEDGPGWLGALGVLSAGRPGPASGPAGR